MNTIVLKRYITISQIYLFSGRNMKSKTHLNDITSFLNYRENNIIYASYLMSFIVWVLVEGAKSASDADWYTTSIYLKIGVAVSLLTVICLVLCYVVKIVKPYLLRKYLIILILVPSSLSYLSLAVMTYLDECVSTDIGNIYYFIHILLMFVIRFWLLKKWIKFDHARIPLRRGEKIYLGESSFEANCRFDIYS